MWPWFCVASFVLAIYGFGTSPRGRGLKPAPREPPDAGMALVIMGLAILAALAAVLQPHSRSGRGGSEITESTAAGLGVLVLVMAVSVAVVAARSWPRDPPDRKPLGLALGSGACLMIAITALGLW